MISFVHTLCGMLYNIYHWYCGVLYNIYNWYLIVAQPWWALVTSPLAQGGRLGKYREVTHVAPGHLSWNLVIWASLSTGLQGRGTVPPRVFDGIAGYVWVCVGGLSLYANTLHVVRGGVELMCTRRPGSVEGEGVSTWPLHSLSRSWYNKGGPGISLDHFQNLMLWQGLCQSDIISSISGPCRVFLGGGGSIQSKHCLDQTVNKQASTLLSYPPHPHHCHHQQVLQRGRLERNRCTPIIVDAGCPSSCQNMHSSKLQGSLNCTICCLNSCMQAGTTCGDPAIGSRENGERMRKSQTQLASFVISVAKISTYAFWGNNSWSKQIARNPYNWCQPVIMHTESEIYDHAYWSCEILMVVCQKIWHGDAVLYYIACCPVCCVVLCIKPPVCCVVFQSIFDMTTPQLVVLYLLYCVLHCLLCCIVCITLCVKTCFTTLSFVVSAPVVSATICQNVTILPGKQWSQHIIVCTHNPPIYLQI